MHVAVLLTHKDAHLFNTSFPHLFKSSRLIAVESHLHVSCVRTSEAFRSVWQWVVSKPFTCATTISDKTDTTHIPALSCASLEGKQQRCQGRDRCSSMPMCHSWHIPHSIAADGEEQADIPLASVYMCALVKEWERVPGQLVLQPREDTISSGTCKRLLLPALEVLLCDTVRKRLTQSASVDTWQNMPTVQAKQPESRDFPSCCFQRDLSLLHSKYKAKGQVFTYDYLLSD